MEAATEPLLSPISADALTPKQKSLFRCAAERWMQKIPFDPTPLKFTFTIDTGNFPEDIVHGLNEKYSEMNKGFSEDIKIYIKKRDATDMQTWLDVMGEYLTKLPFSKQCTILGYTRNGDVFANSILRNTFDHDKFRESLEDWRFECSHLWPSLKGHLSFIPTFYPLYFQALQELRESREPRNTQYANASVSKMPRKNVNANTKANAQLNKKIDEVFTLTGLKQYLYFGYNVASYLPIQTFWIPVIHRFIKDLNAIIAESPPLPCDIRLYRGIKPDGFQPQRQTLRVTGFLSTTSSIGVAKGFFDHKKMCCVQEITVSRGTHTLPLAGLSFFWQEYEFIFGSDTILYISPNPNSNPNPNSKRDSMIKVALVQ